MDRNVDGFWWTWIESAEWPSWYYGETTAKEAARRLAMQHPGRKVYVGCLSVAQRITLPDKLTVE